MRNLFYTVCVGIACFAIVAGCSKQSVDQMAPMPEVNKLVEVTFEQPVDLTVATEMISHEIHIVQLHATMTDNTGTKYTYGRSMEDNELVNIADVHQDAISFFEQQKAIDEQVIQDGIAQGIEDLEMPAVTAPKRIVNFEISYLMMEMTDAQRETLQPVMSELDADITVRDAASKEIESQADLDGGRAANIWVPNVGNVTTGDYTSTIRFAYQRMRWQNDNPFTRWYTYEHDFFLNNYSNDRGTYFSRSQNSQGFPICSWFTNLPSPYLDTRFGDNSNEIAYTIASGDAYKIDEREWYTSTIRVKKGDVNRDVGKLTAQLGTQIPVGCTSSWCSFPVANIRLITAWNIDLPGTDWWSY